MRPAFYRTASCDSGWLSGNVRQLRVVTQETGHEAIFIHNNFKGWQTSERLRRDPGKFLLSSAGKFCQGNFRERIFQTTLNLR
jgi:hypothetical protein